MDDELSLQAALDVISQNQTFTDELFYYRRNELVRLAELSH
jgi:hypothetical protein